MAIPKRSMSLTPNPIVVLESGLVRFADWGTEWKPDVPWGGEWGYTIRRVTNDISYRPGDPMTKEQLKNLIEEGWTVTVLERS